MSGPVLLAGAAPAFLPEVVGLLVATALVAYICHRLQVMPIVSFLLTGAIIGPHALGLVRDPAVIDGAAEVGVVLLLFTIGIEFSLDTLARIKRLIFVGGALQVGLVIGIVTGLLALFGVDWRTGVFTGCLVALSSTAIVMKLLMARRETHTEGGQAALGILIFQDLAVVGMVLLVPMLAGRGEGGWEVALTLAKAAGIVTAVLLVARRVMPRLLEAVARTCSQEIFLLTVVAICLGTAYLTSLAGVSLSLGAFLAGLVVSESRFSQMAVGEILPLQIIFSAVFFVSVGLLLDVGFLAAQPGLVLAAIGGSLVIKLLAAGVSLKALGVATGTAAFTSVLLAQVGEFSFVLERAGRELGLHPAGLASGGPEAFVAATVVMMIATPPISRLCDRLLRRWMPAAKPPAAPSGADAPEPTGHGEAGLAGHVILAGYGDAARAIAPALAGRRIPAVVLTLSPEGASEADRAGLQVLRGNYTRQHELTLAGLRQARLLVVADDDAETAARVVAAARSLHPELGILTRVAEADDAAALRSAGATDVVVDTREAMAGLLGRILEAYGVDAIAVRQAQDRARVNAAKGAAEPVRLTAVQRRNARCAHLSATQDVTPGTPGCEECLATGSTWVHLRLCMTCGHVGCCDQSPNRHARAHHARTGHPIIRSFEPGETWAWCYDDDAYL